jgi:1,2-diacylglycerol 3-alpha-glucosyltransferase
MERQAAVAVVFHHIGPYHHARLNAGAHRLSLTGIEWSAKGYEPWGVADAPAQYEKISLFPEATHQHPGRTQLRRAFCSALEQAKPDVVAVNGWNNFGSLVAASCCLHRCIPMLVMSESGRQDERRTWWKETIKRRIVNLYSAALVGGQRHVEYLVELGMPRERIFTGYDVVDNQYFRQRAEEVRNQNSEVRLKYGLPENYFLASARFIPKKNLARLVRAYAQYRQMSEVRSLKSQVGAPWDLVLLGDGPLREILNSQLSTLNLHAHVHLRGFRPYDELPIYYAFAKAFVHASTTEQWGLVVNEAIASGLPVIVSERCGCVPELVQGNGVTFDPTSEDELTARLFDMSTSSDDERRRLSEASYSIAAKFATKRFGEGLKAAADVANKMPKKFGVIDRAVLRAGAKYSR